MIQIKTRYKYFTQLYKPHHKMNQSKNLKLNFRAKIYANVLIKRHKPRVKFFINLQNKYGKLPTKITDKNLNFIYYRINQINRRKFQTEAPSKSDTVDCIVSINWITASAFCKEYRVNDKFYSNAIWRSTKKKSPTIQ